MIDFECYVGKSVAVQLSTKLWVQECDRHAIVPMDIDGKTVQVSVFSGVLQRSGKGHAIMYKDTQGTLMQVSLHSEIVVAISSTASPDVMAPRERPGDGEEAGIARSTVSAADQGSDG